MNYFGKHDEAVKEVLTFIHENQLLTKGSIPTTEWAVVTDFGEATNLAFDTFFGIEKYSWSDIREMAFSETMNAENEPEVNKLFVDFFQTIGASVRIADQYVEIENEIIEDLYNICYWFAVYGRSRESLFDEMWRAYKHGLWPCGWDGNWPSGRLVVHSPEW